MKNAAAPKTTKLSSNKVNIPAQKLEDIYEISRVIGRGAFSVVYFGLHKKKKEKVAIKIEDGTADDAASAQPPPVGSLKHECKILLYLSGIGDGIPRVRWFEIRDKISFLVMDYYKYSLVDLMNRRGGLRKKDKLDIFKQAFRALKSIHSKFIIHRDIKPANIMLRRCLSNSDCESNSDDSNSDYETDEDEDEDEKSPYSKYEVSIIDFGMAKVYVDEDKEHMEKRTTDEIIGTPKFVSLFVHEHIEPSRRDDFISLAYVLLYMFHELTWYNQPIERVYELKRAHLNNVVSGPPPKNAIFQFISEYLKNCYSLEFDQTYQFPMHIPSPPHDGESENRATL